MKHLILEVIKVVCSYLWVYTHLYLWTTSFHTFLLIVSRMKFNQRDRFADDTDIYSPALNSQILSMWRVLVFLLFLNGPLNVVVIFYCFRMYDAT